eukprot:548751_1
MVISRLFVRSSAKRVILRHIQHKMASNHAYNGWIETMVSPFQCSFSPLQRICQMSNGFVDRHRLTKDTDNTLQIKAIEIWRNSTSSYMDNALQGIENASIVLKLQNSNSCFVLTRVVDGIQLSRIPLDEDGESISDCVLFHQQQMVKLKSYSNDVDQLSMTALAESIINEQSK